MKKIWIIRIILFVLIILWAVTVFNMSNQQGVESSGLSKKITALFFESKELIEKIEPIIRKIAHLSEYALGGALFISLFLTYNWSNKRRISISILLGIWYAILDEIHQLFVPFRNGNIIDVCIDTIGIVLGIVFIMIFYNLYHHKQHKKKEGV